MVDTVLIIDYAKRAKSAKKIQHFARISIKEKDSLYQLVDFFSLFDIKFRGRKEEYSNDYWLQISTTPLYHAWSGFSI